jgi:2-hydroxychromene-2-carboxylate isomerase
MTQPVRVAVDFNCPASYLAVAPTRALEARLDTSFEWLPFAPVAKSRPRVVLSSDDRGARHSRMRAEYVANDLRRYAASRGLDLGEGSRSGDTTAASLGLLWLGSNAPAFAGEYVMRVFDRIWREGNDAGQAFVESCPGFDAQAFRRYVAAEGPAQLEATRVQLAAEHVWNVPAYLVGGELFIGRQHLPMVERLAAS